MSQERSWAIPCAGTSVYSRHHRAEVPVVGGVNVTPIVQLEPDVTVPGQDALTVYGVEVV